MEKIDDKFLVARDELSDFIKQNNIPPEEGIPLFIAAAMYFQDKGVFNGERYLWVYQSSDGDEFALAHLGENPVRFMGEAILFVRYKNRDGLPNPNSRFDRYERIEVRNDLGTVLKTYQELYSYNNTKGKRTSLQK